MKKYLKAVALAALGTVMMNSCIYISFSDSDGRRARVTASGEDSTLVFNGIAATYDGIDIASAMKVTYTASADVITVTADKNLAPYIKVYVEDGELNIHMKGIAINNVPSPVVTVPVSSKPLKSIEVSGASKFSSDIVFENKELSIELSGASKAEIETRVNEIEADASGASSLIISGIADEAEFDASGASRISCDGFSADFAHVDVSGASKISNLAAKAASGSVSGASHLSVKNGCDISKVSTSGASGVSCE